MPRPAAVIRWGARIVAGTGAARLIAGLGHLAGVSLQTVLSIGAGAAALAWLIVLVAVPWNLCFAARRVVTEMAVSRARGIVVEPAQQAEAARIARRMLWFALGGHLVTAAVAGLITYFSGATLGPYVTASSILSPSIPPAAAYFAHPRELTHLSRESCTRGRYRLCERWPAAWRSKAWSRTWPSRTAAWRTGCTEPRRGRPTASACQAGPDRGPGQAARCAGGRPGGRARSRRGPRTPDRPHGQADRGDPGRDRRPPGTADRAPRSGPDDQGRAVVALIRLGSSAGQIASAVESSSASVH